MFFQFSKLYGKKFLDVEEKQNNFIIIHFFQYNPKKAHELVKYLRGSS